MCHVMVFLFDAAMGQVLGIAIVMVFTLLENARVEHVLPANAIT
jgi:hypothetical protein